MGHNHMEYFYNSRDNDIDVLLYWYMCKQVLASMCRPLDVACVWQGSAVPSEWHSTVVLEENGRVDSKQD